MKELSPQAKAILERAAQHAPADPQMATRVRAAIDAKLVAGTASAATSTLGLKALSGLLLVVAIGGGLLLRPGAPPLSTPAPVSSAATASEVHETAPVEPSPILAAHPPARPEPEPRSIQPARARPASRRPARPLATTPEPPSMVLTVDALEAERSAVINARRRLEAGDAPGALVILTEAEDEFGAGNFGLERRSLAARAECAQGDRAAAQRLIDALPPSSPLRLAAERSCLHTEPSPAGHSVDR